ncbi:TPA: tagatose-bisphosphate aldolase, partial [Enterococcus faecium]|nr:tagatose-bisphosphate aldolase [Enterococcus faecium]
TLEWLTEQGTQNIRQLNEVIRETAIPWYEKVSESTC